MIDPEHDPVKEGAVERLSHGVPYRPSLNESEECHFDLIIKTCKCDVNVFTETKKYVL